MAVFIEEQKKPVNWFNIISLIVILAVIGLGVYFLFFVAPPAIEMIIPPPLETAVEITKAQFDPAVVINSQSFRSLRSYVGLPSVGSLGRDNPFLSF